MTGRTPLVVILADLVIVGALAGVLQDLQWRASYAASPHAGVAGYTPSFSYSLIVRFFTMAGNGSQLTSPPTLDWVQVLIYLLVAINGWFAYRVLVSRRARLLNRPQGA
jgi:hypothetical protein